MLPLIKRFEATRIRVKKRRVLFEDEPSDSDDERIILKRRKTKKQKTLPSDLFSITEENSEDSPEVPQTLLQQFDSAWDHIQEEVQTSSIVREKNKQAKLKKNDHALLKWIKIFRTVGSLSKNELDLKLSEVPCLTSLTKSKRDEALENNNLSEKQKTLLHLIRLYTSDLRQKLQNSKVWTSEVNEELVEALHPEANKGDKRQFLKLLMANDKMTEKKKRTQVQTAIYGDFKDFVRHKHPKPASDYLDHKYNKSLTKKGFESKQDYLEAIEIYEDMQDEIKIPKLVQPKSHPDNMKKSDKSPNQKLQCPYPKLIRAESKIEDIQKIFIADYGKLPVYMLKSLQQIALNGIPTQQTQPLVPLSAILTSHHLDTMIAEAKIKLDLKINIDGLTKDKQIRSQVSESLWKLRQLDIYKTHLFLKFIKANLPKNIEFEQAYKSMTSVISFHRKYPLAKLSDTKEKDQYLSLLGQAPKVKNYTRQQLGQKILNNMTYRDKEGNTIFKNEVFFHKTEETPPKTSTS